jgi:hypothetical protein
MKNLESGDKNVTTRTSFTDKNGKDEDNDEEDEVNVDEDEEDGKKGGNAQPKISIKVSSIKSKPSKMAEAHGDSHEDTYDYTLIDELFSILDTESQGEDIEPILAGYFNKIV